jgi:23S rRNA (cytosine1962-C5)-methyltransferase
MQEQYHKTWNIYESISIHIPAFFVYHKPMNSYPRLRLKPDKEVHLRNKHHAIFQNAVAEFPDCPNGSIVDVRAHDGSFLCYATLSKKSYICGRAIAFEEGDPLEQLKATIERSVRLREAFFKNEDTTGYRLINAEGDAVPGLIVDKYADVLVVQLTTRGMDNLKDWVVNVLEELCHPKAIFEKSSGPARKKEELEPVEGWLKGHAEEPIKITERGLTYLINLTGSQKTGLFLDQREMRSLVRQLSAGRTVLDCCSYVGGFSVSALAGGALAADAVDYDAAAIERAREHVAVNNLDTQKFDASIQDVFDYLRRKPLPRQYDFIILDPPAFAKRSTDLEPAKKAYTDLNRLAMQHLPPGSLLLTCSCSYQVDQQIFQTIVFHAARQAKRNVRILQRHRQAFDHPVNLYHPEVDYLKSLLLWIE